MATDGIYNVRHAFPRYRVFIFGAEVTQDVVALTVNYSTGKAPGTCAITLVSPYDKYFINEDDAYRIYRGVYGDTYDTTEVPFNFTALFQDPIKRAVISTKISVPPKKVEQLQGAPNLPVPQAPIERYPFQSGMPIFHPQDPVRVFCSDPFNPTKWYYMFAGFCSDFTDTWQGHGGDKLLTIVAEDSSKLLRYGRFTSNPGLFDITKQMVIDSIMTDLAIRTMHASVFNDMTLPEIFHAILFGSEVLLKGVKTSDGSKIDAKDKLYEDIYGVNGKATVARRRWGTGRLSIKRSKVYEYSPPAGSGDASTGDSNASAFELGPVESIASLEDWQRILDHEVKLSDVYEMLVDTDDAQQPHDPPIITDIYGTIKYIGEHPELYPVDSGRLLMLIPSDFGTGNREIMLKELQGGINTNTEWNTRAEILYAAVERIEFQFYVSPRGDYVVEFPLYDFDPGDFGKYAPDYTFTKADTYNLNATFSDSKVYTQIYTSNNVMPNWDQSSADISDQLNRHYVTLWHMLPLFGPRIAPITQRGYIATPEAALLYAHICLNRLNADAYTQSNDVIPRIQTWLNRPLYMAARDHIGTAKSISHNITWGTQGSMATTLGLYAMRGWDGRTDKDNNKVYQPIANSIASRPWSYSILYKRDKGRGIDFTQVRATSSAPSTVSLDANLNLDTNQSLPYSIKPGAITAGFTMDIKNALLTANRIYNNHGVNMVVTSGQENNPNDPHRWNSKHFTGNAVDLREPPLTVRDDVMKELRAALSTGYYILDEGDHIHIQYNPTLIASK